MLTHCVGRIRSVPLGKQVLDGQELDLPPALVGSLGNDPKKKTVLVYGHYDVQPAALSDGWKHEPFQFTHDKETGRLYGRGSTDDKGPIMGWINAIQAFQETKTEIPVNLRFCFEGMEESGSEGLEELVIKEAKGEFADVDAVCISDNYWLVSRFASLDSLKQLTCSFAGNHHTLPHLRAARPFVLLRLDLGSRGGPPQRRFRQRCARCASSRTTFARLAAHLVRLAEPMTDLFDLFSKLVTPQGKILVPGINEKVRKPLRGSSSSDHPDVALGRSRL